MEKVCDCKIGAESTDDIEQLAQKDRNPSCRLLKSLIIESNDDRTSMTRSSWAQQWDRQLEKWKYSELYFVQRRDDVTQHMQSEGKRMQPDNPPEKSPYLRSARSIDLFVFADGCDVAGAKQILIDQSRFRYKVSI